MRRGDQQDAVIIGIGHQDVTRGIHGDAHGGVERDVGGRGSIGRAARRGSGAGEGGHGAVMEHLANALSAAIGDEEVAGEIQGEGRRLEELGGGGGAAIADGMHIAIAGHGYDDAQGIDAAQADGIGDEEVAVEVGGEVVHGSERGAGGWAAVAGEAGDAVAGVADPFAGDGVGADDEGGIAHVEGSGEVHGDGERGEQGGVGVAAEDGADGAVGVQFADDVVARIGEIEGAGAVERHAGRIVDLGGGGAAAIAAGSGDPGAGDGGELPVGSQFADAVAFELGDIEVAGGVDGDVAGGEKGGIGGSGAVGGGCLAAGAGNGGDDAVGSDAADALVAEVGDVDIAGGIEREAVGEIELGAEGAAAVAAEPGDTGAGDGGDYAAGDFAHAVIVGVGEVEVAEAIVGNSLDVGELGGEWRSAVADAGAAGHGLDMIGHTSGVGTPGLGDAEGERQDPPVILHP